MRFSVSVFYVISRASPVPLHSVTNVVEVFQDYIYFLRIQRMVTG